MSMTDIIVGCIRSRQADLSDATADWGTHNCMTKTRMPRPTTVLSPDASPLARELYRRMVERKLTAAGFSSAAGLSKGYVSEIFAGRSKNPSAENLSKLSKVLECDVEDLLNASSPATEFDPTLGSAAELKDLLPLHPLELTLIKVLRIVGEDGLTKTVGYAAGLLPKGTRKP